MLTSGTGYTSGTSNTLSETYRYCQEHPETSNTEVTDTSEAKYEYNKL